MAPMPLCAPPMPLSVADGDRPPSASQPLAAGTSDDRSGDPVIVGDVVALLAEASDGSSLGAAGTPRIVAAGDTSGEGVGAATSGSFAALFEARSTPRGASSGLS